MTEAEWLGTVLTENTYPVPMLRFFGECERTKAAAVRLCLRSQTVVACGTD
jgi:hypothetical protein